MKVALMAHFFAPSTGGIEITAELLARGFAEQFGDDVTVVTHTPGRLANESELPFAILRQPSPKQLWQVVRQSDIVFHNNPCLQFYWPHLFLGRPWVATMRSWFVVPGEEPGAFGRLKARLKTVIVEHADVLLANSRGTAARVTGTRGVVLNSYRDEHFKLTNPVPRSAAHWVFVGRLLEHKGVQLIIESLAALREEGHDIHLDIVGDGEHAAELRSQANRLGVADHVVFLGSLPASQVAGVLNENGVLILPSQMPETFGTVLVEAAACGVIPVATSHGGAPDAVGDAGLLFAPFSQEALTETMRRLLEDPQLFDTLSSRLADHASRFSGARMVTDYHEYLEAAVAAHRAKRRVARMVPLNRPMGDEWLPQTGGPRDEQRRPQALLVLGREPTGARTGRIAVLESAVIGLRQAGVDVHVLALSSAAGPAEWMGAPVHRVRPPSLPATATAVARAFVGGRTLNSAVFDEARIRRAVADYARTCHAQVVVGDGLRTLGATRAAGLPVIMHLDDLLSRRYSDRSFVEGNASLLGYYGQELPVGVRRIAERLIGRAMVREARLAEHEEIAAVQACAVTAMTSDDEARELAARAKSAVEFIPMAVEVSSSARPDVAPGDSAVFVGALHYGPNLAALRYLQDEVFPRLREQGRGIHVDVIGKIGDSDISEFNDPFFNFVGYADDLPGALSGHRMLLSPVTTGTGVKTKALDGMAVSLPIVATTLGVAGIPVRPGHDVLVADTGAEFANAMIRLMDDPVEARRVGDTGREILEQKMTSGSVYASWGKAYVKATAGE